MAVIAYYPVFLPLTLEAVHSIRTHAEQLHDGISEFTFGGLYFFKDFYKYKVSQLDEHTVIVLGEDRGKRFFCVIGDHIPEQIVKELYSQCEYWKLISETFIQKNTVLFTALHSVPAEDRDNFDYVYTRLSLSTLSGKQLHKKKNHINGFLHNYPDFSIKPLDAATQKDAHTILEAWALDQTNLEETDYSAAQQALLSLPLDNICGLVLYIQNEPAAWCLAELTAQETIAVVHFEKACTKFRGSYQYINYAFAQSLPETVVYINREQDLGDEGLRRAKLSYRPEKFVKKYRLMKGALKV